MKKAEHSTTKYVSLRHIRRTKIVACTKSIAWRHNQLIMNIYAQQGTHLFLVATDGNPDTWEGAGVVVDTQAKTVQRVKQVQKLVRQGQWKSPGKNAPTLDKLVQRVPALRPYRGIEIRLPSGTTAWIRWRQWSSADATVQARLTETTSALTVPVYELDGDYFLATQAVAALGGEVLDLSRAPAEAADEAY
jgi:hypothetical protein